LNISKGEASKILTQINSDAGFGWPVKGSNLDTSRRFWRISESDWVFTYFDDSIHLAHMAPKVEGTVHPIHSRGKELFKYRLLNSKKSFALSKLPDCFRLLSSAGQSNVHEIWGTRRLVELLAGSDSELDVCAKFRRLTWNEWLDTLGPHGWESLCLGYLILQTDFVPTGLDVGGTLPLFDLIGKNQSGQRIYAQCKKNPLPMVISSLALAGGHGLGKERTLNSATFPYCPLSDWTKVRSRGMVTRNWGI
jgi:hypothetical protein